MQQTPSSPADELAREHHLGVLRDINFENNPSRHILQLLFSLFFLAIVGYMLHRIQPALSLSFLIVLLLTLLGLLGVAFRIRALIRNYRQRGTSLSLYEYGLVRLQYSDRKLVYLDALHWQDIAVVWHEIKEKTGNQGEEYKLHLYRLQRRDGTLFGGENYKLISGMPGLFSFEMFGVRTYKLMSNNAITAVKQETLRYLWPEMFDRYQSGFPVSFGPLTITRQGILYKDRSITWDEISIIDCSGHSQRVTINMRRESAKLHGWPIQIHIPLGEVPNAHVLRRLLIIIHEQQAPTQFNLFGVFRKDIIEALTPVS